MPGPACTSFSFESFQSFTYFRYAVALSLGKLLMQTSTLQLTPCNKHCIMDPVTHYCKGCFRTIEEIIRWQFLNEDEKNKILHKVEVRKTTLNTGTLKAI